MKDYKWAFVAMWGFTALAIIVGLYFTHKASCICYMLIPAVIQHEAIGEKEDDKNDT